MLKGNIRNKYYSKDYSLGSSNDNEKIFNVTPDQLRDYDIIVPDLDELKLKRTQNIYDYKILDSVNNIETIESEGNPIFFFNVIEGKKKPIIIYFETESEKVYDPGVDILCQSK